MFAGAALKPPLTTLFPPKDDYYTDNTWEIEKWVGSAINKTGFEGDCYMGRERSQKGLEVLGNMRN
jgi:hypothetical protein